MGPVSFNGSLDVRPRSNDGAEHHQTKREQGHGRDASTEPEDLSVGNDDDGQVLEDGVHGNREELERLGARVDHSDEEQRDGEPCIATCALAYIPSTRSHNIRGNVHFFALTESNAARFWKAPSCWDRRIAIVQTIAWEKVSHQSISSAVPSRGEEGTKEHT